MNYLKSLIFISILIAISACKDPVESPPVIIEKDTAYGSPFAGVPSLEDMVFYEVNLRAFSESGDLPGVTERLDEIKSLGVNVIWLMPIHPVGEINSVNSPYSVKDYNDIASEYGSISDLRILTDEAHQRDMAVIMDWVANHTSWDNPWISNKEWYTQDESGNIVQPAGTNWADVADLNYANTDMQDAMIDAMKYWVWESNIDGFRCDYADGVPQSFWERAIDSLKAMPNRDIILLAEGSRSDHFSAGFDIIYGWDFYYKMIDIYNGNDASELIAVHESEFSRIPEGKQILRYSTNHDESAWNKTPMQLFNGQAGALAASVATIYLGGIPLFYTGQEVGTLENVPFFSNSTISWDENTDMLNAYKEIMNFYTESDAARSKIESSFSDQNIISFTKYSETDTILVIINFRNETKDYTLPEELKYSSWNNALSETNITLDSILQLEAFQYYILKK